jgi:hypothetical protein
MGERQAELHQWWLDSQPLNVAVKLNLNAWKGKEYLQIVVEDIKPELG